MLVMSVLNALCLIVAVLLWARSAHDSTVADATGCFAAVLDSVRRAGGDRSSPDGREGAAASRAGQDGRPGAEVQ